MADNIELFHGAGGGNKSATNTPDDLFSEDVIELALAISEGPIRGLSEGAKSFYVGGTPLMSQDGALNFQKFAIGVHPGYPEGMAKKLDLVLGGTASNSNVGVTLFSGSPVIRQTDSILRNRIDSLEVRINFSRLMRTDDKGNYKHKAVFQIEYKPASSGAWKSFYNQSQITLEGKTSGGVVKEFTVSVPRINDDYQIRVTKISPDSNEKVFVDMTFESFQMLTREPKAYPDTALIHLIGVATGQLTNVPDLLGVYDGLLVRVPTNYNPDTRTYDDTVPWNGSFKFAWTNNPAWILYEMIVNPRWGLAAHRLAVDANRFDFYLAARWCDTPVLVNDGPETRPRFTFNDIVSEPRPAMEMLNYVAGSFNAIVWDDLQGQIHLKVDKDEPAVMMFTPENVGAAGFEYTFTDIATRANDISVGFINPDLDWNEDRRRIPGVTTSEENIAQYGRIPLDFIAVGCTNAHEAITKAQVRLISALTETTMVSFTTTRQGAMLGLLDVILVADPVMGWSQSGRLTEYDSNFINFRDAIYIEEMKEYVVKLQTVEGIKEVRVLPEQIGHVYRFKLRTPLPPNIPRYTVFSLEETEGYGFAKPFRVTKVEEMDQYQFRISGIELNRNKYVQSESNTNLDEIQYSYKNPGLPGAPTNFTAESGDDHVIVDAVTGVTTTRIYTSWRRPSNIVVKSYELQYQRAGVDADWVSIPEIPGLNCYISPAEPGVAYNLRVRSISPKGTKSGWVQINAFFAVGLKVKPETVTSFTATGDLFQNILNWEFGNAPNILKVEVWGSNADDLGTASLLTDLSYPTNSWVHTGLDMGHTIYYWLRVQNTSRVFSDFTSPSRSARTVTDPDKITKLLIDQLDDSVLLPELRDRINLIDGPAELAGSVAAQLQAEARERAEAVSREIAERVNSIQAEAQKRADALLVEARTRTAALAAEALARATGITNEATTRQSGDEALAQTISTLSANTNNGIAAAIQQEAQARVDGDTATATLLTNLVATTKGQLTGLITEEQTARTDGDSALAQSILTLSAQNGNDITAAIQNEAKARVDGDTAVASQTATLVATTRNDIQALISTESTARATEDSAINTRQDALRTRVGNAESAITTLQSTTSNDSGATAQALNDIRARVGANESSISQLNYVAADSGSALARAVVQLTGRVGNAEGAITNETTLRINAVNAVASDLNAVRVRVGNSEGAINQLNYVSADSGSALARYVVSLGASNGDSSAAIANEASIRANGDSALGQRIDAVTARVGANEGSIGQLNYVSSDSGSALARSVVQLNSTVGGYSASIQNLSTTVNGLSAMQYIKLDVNGFVSGYGISSSGATSEFIVNASRFVIAIPGYEGRYPFIVGALNGTVVTAINGAVIADSTISVRSLIATSISAINANLGEITAGVARNSDWSNYINFNARPGTDDAFLVIAGGQTVFRANGTGAMARKLVTPPDIVASGNVSLNSPTIAYTTDPTVDIFTYYIDTGVFVNSSWSVATTDMYECSATISAGISSSGGCNGYSNATVVVGDGLGNSSFPVDNKIYIKFQFTAMGNNPDSARTIQIRGISWKLVRV